ncbi:siderophore biosynthesis protein SbnG [Ramlibacter sp. AW1]|uniref:Siderophore biosynthesis protein SbnG n=1 Tax=Ramlibacter aurantiacus TaxID=2801330 RepID=A0A936ZRF7_9BURK|nr:aldolase/citrate lyase family protein [Ramlibacter aurantiacus]MBL0419309.1 siderophore biosynthesis protein SbnG [Ramlibacter aurantiacus]
MAGLSSDGVGARNRRPSLRDRLGGNRPLVGMQCFSASPVLVECMGEAGFDFTVLDMEHCPTQLETVAHLMRAADAQGMACLVRVPDLDAPLIGRTLDLGAQGIVLPHATVERARAAVRAARYAPQGERGACPVVRSAGWLPADWDAHAARSARETLVVPLVEDEAGVAQIDDIFALDGIDIVFLGPFDLAIAMGLGAADFRHPRLADVLDTVVSAARRHGKHVMSTVGATIDEAYAESLRERGVRLLSFSADVAVFMAACRRIARLGQSQESS